ncbi:hypothetical protein JI666_13950 [Bacillus sp. NTK071]|uniref:hypothetical protein n=1 Tax=Bacillus sp. NTK071 TaxID=2802175 RepID=UPI001A8EC88B|nr:hypothetical protein [Bacillus sp. NTK071]MBN8209855.1 hypothetical protein [Bacillus sp. NTK071]
MLKRKVKTALLTSLFSWVSIIILGVIIGVIYKISGGADKISPAIGSLFLIIILIVPIVLVVGIPISMLSDTLTKNTRSKYRRLYSLSIHVGSGLLLHVFVFPISYQPNILSYLLNYSFYLGIIVIISSIFWIIDEMRKNKPSFIENTNAN